MGALVSALEMLDLYTGEARAIDCPDVDALIARGHHERVWAMTDAVAERRLARALELLDAFWTDGMAAPQIVGLLRVQFRQLVRVTAFGRHMGLDAAMAKAGVPRGAFARVRRAVEAFSDDHLADAYQALVDADLAAKTSAHEHLAMETLIHRLSNPEAARFAPDAAALE
jgi:DNA polymerase III delta subunit